MCNIQHEKHCIENVANVTFIFGTSPNTKAEEKKWGDMAYYIPLPKKMGGTRSRVPHQIAPMPTPIVTAIRGRPTPETRVLPKQFERS